MKKIRLNVANLGATEILSREQLKSIFGGTGSSTGSGSGSGGNHYQGETGGACVTQYKSYPGTWTWMTWTTPPGWVCVMD